MPHPSARARFGIASQPYSSYFPQIPSEAEMQDRLLRSIPLSAYDPDWERKADQRGQAEALMENFNPEDQTQITGLQRMVGQGTVDPRRASAMFSMADRVAKQKMAQQALAQRQEIIQQKARTPTASQIKNIEGLADQYEQLNEMSDVANDEAKAKAAQKFYGARAIPLDLTPDSKDPYAGMTPEAWKKGYHGLHDKLESNYLTAVRAMMDAGKPVDDRHLRNYQQIMDSRKGDQPTAQSNSQSTEQRQSAPVSKAPNQAHILLLQKDPSLAAQFDAKFGAGAAARVLGQ